jgi:hypothetical protein
MQRGPQCNECGPRSADATYSLAAGRHSTARGGFVVPQNPFRTTLPLPGAGPALQGTGSVHRAMRGASKSMRISEFNNNDRRELVPERRVFSER